MTIQRQTPFGFPVGRPQQSGTTLRLVPLTQGMSAHRPFTNEPPGSASSLCNFLPINGALIPRSRMSSIAQLPRGGQVLGMTEVVHVGSLSTNQLWVVGGGSSVTDNLACMPVDGGAMSQASFVSTNGMGTKPSWLLASAKPSFALYPSVFDTNVMDDVLLIALPKPNTSAETILAAGITSAGTPIYSYLTNAPQAKYITAYDYYVVAWNIDDGTGQQQRRVQWSSRGDPGIWTGGNAGFEDLLSMKGYGTGIAVLDSRLILFSSNEVWVGVPGGFPSQFQFSPLDTTIGCSTAYASTIVNTELGLLFLGSDSNVRLLPRGGGLSVIVNPDIGVFLRERSPIGEGAWAWYDEARRLYKIMPFIGGTAPGVIVNLNTGEWGTEYTGLPAMTGCYVGSATAEKLYAGDIQGRVYSTDSRLKNDTRTAISQFTVTSQYRSEPMGLDLPDGRRQVVSMQWNYRATSAATAAVNISGDYGNSFPPAPATVQLSIASFGQSYQLDRSIDGPAPVVEWTSDNTGYELHRASVTLGLRGRP